MSFADKAHFIDQLSLSPRWTPEEVRLLKSIAAAFRSENPQLWGAQNRVHIRTVREMFERVQQPAV